MIAWYKTDAMLIEREEKELVSYPEREEHRAAFSLNSSAKLRLLQNLYNQLLTRARYVNT